MNTASFIPPGAGQVNSRDRTLVSRHQKYGNNTSMTAKQMIDRDRMNEATKDKLRKAFQDVDVNQDGLITRDEMRDHIMQHIAKTDPSADKFKQREREQSIEQVVSELFAQFDQDDNGSISLEEFIECYVDTKQKLEDMKVDCVRNILNHHRQWDDVSARYKEAQEQQRYNPNSFQPILKVFVIDAQNLAPGTNSKVICLHNQRSCETMVRVGEGPIFNESFVFDSINESQSLQIRLVNQRGNLILSSDLFLQDFLNYDEIDEDYWIYIDENDPNKEQKPKVCVKIQYHWSEVAKFESLNKQYQDFFYSDLTQYHHTITFLAKLADPFKFMSTLTSGMIDQFDDIDIQDMEEQKKLENETAAKVMSQIENNLQGISEKYGYKEVPWLDLTKFFLFIELILVAFSGYYRADFLTLSGVAISWFYILLPERVRLSQFRSVVMLIVISLIYDIVWFMMVNDSGEDENGNTMRTPKRVSSFFAYVSFFWKIPLCIILFKDSTDFVGIIKQKNTQTGVESDQRKVDEYYYNWQKNIMCCEDHQDDNLPLPDHPDAQNVLQ